MNLEILLILFESTLVEGGYVFYPARAKDKPLFYHCVGAGPAYMFSGGTVHLKVVKIAMEIFKLHGYEPVLTGMETADWDIPLRNGEIGYVDEKRPELDVKEAL